MLAPRCIRARPARRAARSLSSRCATARRRDVIAQLQQLDASPGNRRGVSPADSPASAARPPGTLSGATGELLVSGSSRDHHASVNRSAPGWLIFKLPPAELGVHPSEAIDEARDRADVRRHRGDGRRAAGEGDRVSGRSDRRGVRHHDHDAAPGAASRCCSTSPSTRARSISNARFASGGGCRVFCSARSSPLPTAAQMKSQMTRRRSRSNGGADDEPGDDGHGRTDSPEIRSLDETRGVEQLELGGAVIAEDGVCDELAAREAEDVSVAGVAAGDPQAVPAWDAGRRAGACPA